MEIRNQNKMFRKLLIVLALLPALGASAQACSGDFTWLQNGLTITFYGTTSPGITNIVWDFGDGNFNTSNTTTTAHTYAAPGTYNVCIQYSDSTCSDSTCHTIVLDSCYGSMTYSINGTAVDFYGFASNSTANTVYQWNFGDNTTASTQNPQHTYANPGTYTVCFAYYDLTTGCADSICYPLSTGCNADFSWVDSMGYVFFINQSTLGTSGMYYWDFGDGNYSTQYAPSYQYMSPGIYTVCLVATDSMSNFCDSTCHYVNLIPQTSTRDHQESISHLTLAPNPSDESFRLSFQLDQPGTVSIGLYDLSGRMVNEPEEQYLPAGQQIRTFDTKDLAAGTYFVRIHMNGHVAVNRLVVTHKL